MQSMHWATVSFARSSVVGPSLTSQKTTCHADVVRATCSINAICKRTHTQISYFMLVSFGRMAIHRKFVIIAAAIDVPIVSCFMF